MGVNTIIVGVQAIVLIPLYLRAFGPRLYGAWLGTGDILNFLQLFDLGLTAVILQRIGAAHARGDRRAVGEYFASALVLMTTIGGILALAALLVSFWIATWMHLEGADAALLVSCFRVGALVTFLYVANFSVLGLARGVQDAAYPNAGMILGALTGFGTSLFLLLRGWGLWSIVIGMCGRTAVSLLVSIVYVFRLRGRGDLVHVRPTRSALLEFVKVSPATTLSGIGYLLVSQTEATLVAVVIGPGVVPVLALTRRAVDIAAGLLNTLSYSSFAGFSHLVESPERRRAMEVYVEIGSLWLTLALSAAAAYVAVNPSLVPLWAGPAVFGGRGLTLLLAVQMIVVGRAQMMYYLYRAAGAIVPGSMLQFWESMARFAVMIGLLKVVGIAGPALAAILVALPASEIAIKRTRKLLQVFATPARATPAIVWLGRAAVVVVGVLACFAAPHTSWIFVVAVAFGVAITATLGQAMIDPHLSRILAAARSMRSQFRFAGRAS
jgi:O-antigen/teichoic acid export membrane protein